MRDRLRRRTLHANYSGRGRTANLGQSPVTLPPNDFQFDQAIRQGLSFNNYGEYNAGNLPAGNDGRPQSAVRRGLRLGYPLFFGGDGGASPRTAWTTPRFCDTDSGTVGSGGKVATSRFDFYQSQFRTQLAAGTVPALTYLTLPKDHPNGVRQHYPTPSALVRTSTSRSAS